VYPKVHHFFFQLYHTEGNYILLFVKEKCCRGEHNKMRGDSANDTSSLCRIQVSYSLNG